MLETEWFQIKTQFFISNLPFFGQIKKLPFAATGFTAVEETGAATEYVIGQAAPVDTSVGTAGWEIQLEEQIPVGSPEIASPSEPCVLKIITDQKTEIYSGCRWTQIRREFSKQGLRRIRKGVALQREEQ